MAPPRVLVLLAAYNGATWIKEQIDSILGQIGVEVDLIVSDDGSSDGTPELLSVLADGKRVRTTCPALPTGSAAQNFLFLIRSTPADRYDYVALADQDDIWDRDKLALACARIGDEDAVAYSCAVRAFWENGREKTLRQSTRLTRSDFLFEGAGQGCTFVLRSEFYEPLRAFLVNNPELTKTLHFHDWAIYAICRSWRLQWVFDQRAHLRYRQHANNDTGARASVAGIGKRLTLIRDGWYARQLNEIAAICTAAAPSDPLLSAWRGLLDSPHDLKRKTCMLRFCLQGCRRRALDKVAVLTAILAGWI